MRNNLREFREKLGYTQQDFAEIIGRSRQHYCNLERGNTRGSADVWFAIQRRFNLNLEQIENLREVQPDERE